MRCRFTIVHIVRKRQYRKPGLQPARLFTGPCYVAVTDVSGGGFVGGLRAILSVFARVLPLAVAGQEPVRIDRDRALVTVDIEVSSISQPARGRRGSS